MNASSTFQPIPELARMDADVFLIFLQNQAVFSSPVNDPWFCAQNYVNDSGTPLWRAALDSPVSVMGCAVQAQFCNSHTSECTPLTGAQVLNPLSDYLELNERQKAVLSRLKGSAFNGTSLDFVVKQLGPTGMRVEQSTTNMITTTLPDNQWVVELENWFTVMLSTIQLNVESFSGGPSKPQLQTLVQRPAKEDEWMCTNQTGQREGYTSFNIFALAFIIVTGFLIIISSALFDIFVHVLCERTQWGNSKCKAWKMAENQYFQRLMFESRDVDLSSFELESFKVLKK
jgi:hypothetical protein